MSNPELESDTYDVVVIGTGLAESIAAAALAKAGKTVLHLDPNEYYGASQASLTLDELVAWSESHSHSLSPPSTSSSSSTLSTHYSAASTSALDPSLEVVRRQYALSLFPSVLPSRGALIDTLIASDVSKYVSFRMLDSVSIWSDDGVDTARNPQSQSAEDSSQSSQNQASRLQGKLKKVPGSKEEVFKDKSVSLMEKRKLMKFLMFAGGDFEDDELLRGKEDQPLLAFLEETFSLPTHLATSIAYAITYSSALSDPTLPALHRARRYLKSIGRYGTGAFLVGQYGGAGEVAQGFCRACAVFGGTYVLGASAKPRSIKISPDTDRPVELDLPCHSRPVYASHIISAPQHLSVDLHPSPDLTRTIARCIAVVKDESPEKPQKAPEAPEVEDDEEDKENDDTGIVIFPPEKEGEGVVRALKMGHGTGSCPQGQYILYLSKEVGGSASNPAETLRPYLHRLAPEPLFESYHLTHYAPSNSNETTISSGSPLIVLSPYAGLEGLTEGLDWEAEQGRAAYLAIVGEGEGVKGFFEKEEGEGEAEELDEF